MYHWIDTIASSQLRQISPSVRILLAHPQHKSHQTLIGHFWVTRQPVYLKVDTPIRNHEDLDNLLKLAYANHEITKSQFKTTSLILDDIVTIAPGLLIEFLQKYLKQNPEGTLLYCNRRYLDLIEHFPEIKSVTCLWPISNEWMLIDYLQRDQNRNLVEVYALGAGRVVVNGNAITDWGGDLVKHLFFYLIDRGLQTRQQVFDIMWPASALREATNLFHVTKRKLNSVLGFNLTAFGGGYYHLSHDIDLHYDVSAYIALLQQSDMSHSIKDMSLLQRCMALYRGEFLTEMDGDWIQARRSEMRGTHAEVLANAAYLNDLDHQRERAIGQYSRAVAFDPSHEEYARHLKRIETSRSRIPSLRERMDPRPR